uniref:TIGR03986 family CRISPR-associated RAMP protein n=1 Tax=Desulfatirhabdium butyrativorans TaxID=340467 RepID=A0A7C4RQP4_9BACT
MIRHVNPTDSKSTAKAPYNFVPLPNSIFVVQDGININGTKLTPWKMHDRFVPGTRSGWIDLTIETLTPLFIRGPVINKDGKWDCRDARFRFEPFTSIDGRPMIPGSSLRGMIRTVVEILSFSKIKPVTDEKPFFRTVAADRIGVAYRNRLIRGNEKPFGGYIRKDGNHWMIVPAAEVLRIHRDELNKRKLNVPSKPNPGYFPDWKGQHKTCWFRRDPKKNSKAVEISLSHTNNWERGTLVLTGSAPKKKYDFIFVGEETGKSIPIPEVMWRRFHDEDQLTHWQEKAFPKDIPVKGCRKAKGHLREGEPVFFLCDNAAQTEDNPKGLVFFGRAQMFRFPYDLSPRDLVPDQVKNAGLDMAGAIFGVVGVVGKKEELAIKGRIFFEDALSNVGGPEWFEEIIVPQILASPKVTCFQHYLTQDGTKGQKELTTYLNGDHTTIRGHKLYWHRWDDDKGLEAIKEFNRHNELLDDLQSANSKDTQHTVIRPVKQGVVFNGKIRFENLTDIELGALLSSLRLQEGCNHKLGMGKPLGLGSIKVDWKLHHVDRADRYNCWERSGVTANDGGEFIKVFEKAMIEHARNTGEKIDESVSGLKKISRLQALFHLLKWTGKPKFSETAYMTLEKFRSRPVLPTPHKVVGHNEPAWSVDSPRPAQNETTSNRTESTKPAIAKAPIPPPSSAAKPVEKGQTRHGQLKHSGDRWIALFEGDIREAVIINQNKIPHEVSEGCIAEFFITEQSKKAGIKARFEKLL